MDRFKYFESANKDTMIIIHIEGVKGISNLDEILSVPVSMLFLLDPTISQSLGIPGKVHDPIVEEKMQEVILKCRQQKVGVGTFTDDVQTAKKWVSLGVQYMSFSVDVGILYDACCSLRDNLNLKNSSYANI